MGVATYEPDRVLGSTGMSISQIGAWLVGDRHSGTLLMQPAVFDNSTRIHDIILAHGVSISLLSVAACCLLLAACLKSFRTNTTRLRVQATLE